MAWRTRTRRLAIDRRPQPPSFFLHARYGVRFASHLVALANLHAPRRTVRRSNHNGMLRYHVARWLCDPRLALRTNALAATMFRSHIPFASQQYFTTGVRQTLRDLEQELLSLAAVSHA